MTTRFDPPQLSLKRLCLSCDAKSVLCRLLPAPNQPRCAHLCENGDAGRQTEFIRCSVLLVLTRVLSPATIHTPFIRHRLPSAAANSGRDGCSRRAASPAVVMRSLVPATASTSSLTGYHLHHTHTILTNNVLATALLTSHPSTCGGASSQHLQAINLELDDCAPTASRSTA